MSPYKTASASSITSDVAAAMAHGGMAPVDHRDIRTDGVICRFDCIGDRPGKRNAWAVVFADGVRPVVTFGHWARNIHATVVLGQPGPMSKAERDRTAMAFEAARLERERLVAQARENARREANARWAESQPASASHPYLIRKGIGPEGLHARGTTLLVPLRDDLGVLHNVQSILANGNKRFLKGGRVKGCYASIGTAGEHFLLVEGWATGASLHAATGLPAAVCFSAGNLGNVARILRAKYPGARLTICADNDPKPDGSNIGVTSARDAAALVGGYVAIPPQAGDWNDYINAADGSIRNALCEEINHDNAH